MRETERLNELLSDDLVWPNCQQASSPNMKGRIFLVRAYAIESLSHSGRKVSRKYRAFGKQSRGGSLGTPPKFEIEGIPSSRRYTKRKRQEDVLAHIACSLLVRYPRFRI